MVFSSNVFLFAFLPVFLGAYYALPARWRLPLIVAASYVFYGWWRVDFLLLIVVLGLATYGIGKRIAGTPDVARRRLWLAAGVAGNLAVLGYFKYFNFGVENLNALLVAMGGRPFDAWSVILPIGISFFIFQKIGYLVDVARGDAPPAPGFAQFSAFTMMFPQLIAGPILRYKEMERQFAWREHSFDRFSEGAFRFMVGFSKKVLVADAVAPLVDLAFAQPEPSFAEAWLGALAYTIQLYFDFSGYSDMAIGLGLMIGFRFPENFDRPYASPSITVFWRRWHMSLSAWLRDYVYIPLGGNRRGPSRTHLHLLVTMALGGLWHGASWTFVLWGLWHWLWLAAERVAGGRLWPGLAAVPATFLVVALGWVLFRAPDLGVAGRMYSGMLGMNGWAVGDTMAWQIGAPSLAALGVGLVLVLAGMRPRRTAAAWLPGQGVLVALFGLAVLKLAAASYSPFLYFQF